MMKHNIQYDIGLISWKMDLSHFNGRLSGSECGSGDVNKPDCDKEEEEMQSLFAPNDHSISVVLDEQFLDDCWSQWKEKHNKDYADQHEDRVRRAKWTDNMIDIMKHNVKCEFGLSESRRCLDQFAAQVSP
ncbi:hypothetical protein FBUS_02735 [Fasciolopsis buskii]|uniref:Cathepsin propeptide inhibitor domain-containing protein n=1 Tax=Fasciolopsis buskii TaxID=27845 RepID=A0A8E0RXH9_9TREM|nr:hypothetical protein FBUS_02735 [Fasciolopsis buski]